MREADGAANVVRVDFRRLDTLLEVLGEGLIEQSAVAEAFRRVARRAGATPGLPELDRAILALEKTMKRLEAVVMETRLLPISSVFGRFPRLLRGVAEGVGKRVRLETSGGETALDKAVLDRLGEPLLHLLTNAVVHGIETPADRRQAGKPEESVPAAGAPCPAPAGWRSSWPTTAGGWTRRGSSPAPRSWGSTPPGRTAIPTR